MLNLIKINLLRHYGTVLFQLLLLTFPGRKKFGKTPVDVPNVEVENNFFLANIKEYSKQNKYDEVNIIDSTLHLCCNLTFRRRCLAPLGEERGIGSAMPCG